MRFSRDRLRPSLGRERDWRGVRVVVLGLARQGKALTRYLAERGADVVVSDIKPAEAMQEATQELDTLLVEYVFGGHPPTLLEDADLLCLSGGIPADLPLALQAREQGIPLSNDSQLFMQACPAPVLGITGSAGKTTTTTLVGRMATAEYQKDGGRVWVGGNIGQPLLTELPKITAADLVVMELSSFQLELMQASPQIAAILNVTPNHLDRHKTMEAYTSAKARILAFQSEQDVAVLGHEDDVAWSLRHEARGEVLSFGWESPERNGAYLSHDMIRLKVDDEDRPVCPLEAVELRGEHNLLNVIAACAIAAAAGVSPDAMEAGVRGFEGVPHRLEFVGKVGGAAWYNDSIATTPERAIAAIQAFDEPLVLLAGGRDKDLPWEAFAALVCERVDHLILFGEAAGKIAGEIERWCEERSKLSVEICASLEQAVIAASNVAQEGDVVLLAPGGTSFDEFADFAERGERFREWVKAL
ncbi:MAG: UDP-N-acetylmuramoyl-L-alanine--D-glutamate ligase [Anaerolineales bacterium]|nr:UDP-N-acetylmuramoyl-L-alanine--D-glutamate ligase [Anaerolineales bacterium]